MLMRLSGKSEAEIPIQYTGLRPGEKLYEELFYGDEGKVPTSIDGLHMAKGRIVNWPILNSQLHQLAELLDGSAVSIRQKVKEIIPEYQQPGVMDILNKEAVTGLTGLSGRETCGITRGADRSDGRGFAGGGVLPPPPPPLPPPPPPPQ
jgi:hypothetical protein